MFEEWRDIPGYENLYQVSNLGRVKGLKRNKTLNPGINSAGYRTVRLSKNNIKPSFLVHRLVALAFLPNPENKPIVDHIDGNKLNNDVFNLRWTTQEENMNNPATYERMYKNNYLTINFIS